MNNHEAVAGIDIGSRSIELVVFDGTDLLRQVKMPTTSDPLAQCEKLLAGMNEWRVAATGYGRKLFFDPFQELNVTTITESQAYALGARYLFPEARTVLEIDGQDTKVILLRPHGRVAKFEMNDRCAAGTGKFLEFMATALQIPLEAFGEYALRSEKRIQINSMCTVFAESKCRGAGARMCPFWRKAWWARPSARLPLRAASATPCAATLCSWSMRNSCADVLVDCRNHPPGTISLCMKVLAGMSKGICVLTISSFPSAAALPRSWRRPASPRKSCGSNRLWPSSAGDTGRGEGSIRIYQHLCQRLSAISPEVIVFHHLKPDAERHNRVFMHLEKLAPRPILVTDAGFMYVAKMSGFAACYDLFTPDAGELAFLADEKAPHPFYTQGFILQEEERAPELIQRAYQHENASRYLLVKGRCDLVASSQGILDRICEPSVETLEPIGELRRPWRPSYRNRPAPFTANHCGKGLGKNSRSPFRPYPHDQEPRKHCLFLPHGFPF